MSSNGSTSFHTSVDGRKGPGIASLKVPSRSPSHCLRIGEFLFGEMVLAKLVGVSRTLSARTLAPTQYNYVEEDRPYQSLSVCRASTQATVKCAHIFRSITGGRVPQETKSQYHAEVNSTALWTIFHFVLYNLGWRIRQTDPLQ